MKKENNLNVNFKKMFSSNKRLTRILFGMKDELLLVTKTLSNYERNGNRHGVIFMARETDTGRMQKIIIDAIYGEPNSTQVKDLTYGIGTDCDKRIIFYTLENPGYTKNEYRYEHEMVNGFTKVNNDCGVETFVVNVSLNSDKNRKYTAEVYPDENRTTLIKKLPTKQEFDQAAFGIFYNYSSDWRNPHHIEHPENWFDNYWHLIFQDISFRYPIWTESGLSIQGVSKSEIGDINLKWFMDNKIELLKKFFDNREININTLPSGRNIMEIKLWDKPISYFAKTSIKNKERIAEAIRGYDSVTFEFLDNLFERQMPDKEVLKDLGYFPGLAFMDLDKEISA